MPSLFIFLNNHVYGGSAALSSPSAPDAPAHVQPRKGTALAFLHYGPQAAQLAVAPVTHSFDESCLYVARTALVFERPTTFAAPPPSSPSGVFSAGNGPAQPANKGASRAAHSVMPESQGLFMTSILLRGESSVCTRAPRR